MYVDRPWVESDTKESGGFSGATGSKTPSHMEQASSEAQSGLVLSSCLGHWGLFSTWWTATLFTHPPKTPNSWQLCVCFGVDRPGYLVLGLSWKLITDHCLGSSWTLIWSARMKIVGSLWESVVSTLSSSSDCSASLSTLNGASKTKWSWSSEVYWLVGGMGLIDWSERGKEIKEKEHSQECERKGWWEEKGEEESRERGEIQRLEEGVSFCSPIQQLSFEYLLGASPRARQWAYGSKQRAQSSSFYETYLLLEKAMAPHSSTLAWKIPWTEEPDGLQSMGSLRVGHDWVTSLWLFTFMHWRRKWQPTPVFLPGESQGRGSLVGCRLWDCTELDTTEVT